MCQQISNRREDFEIQDSTRECRDGQLMSPRKPKQFNLRGIMNQCFLWFLFGWVGWRRNWSWSHPSTAWGTSLSHRFENYFENFYLYIVNCFICYLFRLYICNFLKCFCFSADGNYEVRYKSNVLIYPDGEVLWIPPAIYQVKIPLASLFYAVLIGVKKKYF